MKKIYLLLLGLTISFFSLAQESQMQTVTFEPHMYSEPADQFNSFTGPIPPPITERAVFQNGSRSIVIVPCGTAANAYSNIRQKSDVWVDPDLGTIINIHRMGGSMDPSGSSGDLGYDISFNHGVNWSLMNEVYQASNDSERARYPQAGIYNPTNNIDDAKLVYFAPVLDGSNSAWGGYCNGTSNLNTPYEITKNLQSSTSTTKQFIPDGFEITSQGTVFVLDENYNDISDNYLQQLIISKGTYNSVTEDFEYEQQILPATCDRAPQHSSIAFGPDGQTGYIVILANNGMAEAIGNYKNIYPIYWKTDDAGESWDGPHYLQLDGPNGFPSIVNEVMTDEQIEYRYPAVDPQRDEIPYSTGPNCDIAVDANNNLHIGVSIIPSDPNADYYVLAGYDMFSTFDIFTTNQGGNWHAEKLSDLKRFIGEFGEISCANRVQITTNKDRNRIFVSWQDTFNENALSNNKPDICCAGINIDDWTKTNPINVTSGTSATEKVTFFSAPNMCFEDNGDYTIPFFYLNLTDGDAINPAQYMNVYGFSINDNEFIHNMNVDDGTNPVVKNLGTTSKSDAYWNSARTVLWADPDLNMVSNIHGMGGLLDPDGHWAHLGYDVSFDGGDSWSLMNQCYTAENNSEIAHFAHHGIYNPTNNVEDAKLVYFAAIKDGSNNLDRGGYCHGTVNPDNVNSSTKNLMHSEDPFFMNWPNAFDISTQGVAIALDQNIENFENYTCDPKDSLIITRGVWSDTEQDFIYNRELLPLLPQQSLIKDYDIAFSPDGQTAYIAILSDNGMADQIEDIKTWYPIIYKSTDGGNTWSEPTFVQISGENGLDTIVNHHLTDDQITSLFGSPAPARTEIAYSTTPELDIAVDVNGNLHIAAIVCANTYGNYNHAQRFSLKAYDIFTTNGGTDWQAEPLGVVEVWSGNIPGISSMKNSIQVTSTKNGEKLFFSWNDSDEDVTLWNDQPDIFCRGIDVVNWKKTANMNNEDFPTNLTVNTDAEKCAYLMHTTKWCLESDEKYKIPYLFLEAADPGLQIKYLHNAGIEESAFTIPVNVESTTKYEPVWNGNPYQPMTIIVNGASVSGLDLVDGDEIAVFDVDGEGNEICIGAGTLIEVLDENHTLVITAATDDPESTDKDGFTEGNSIIYKLWDESEQTEYTAVSADYNLSFDNLYTSLGTALVSLAGYAHFQPVWTGNPYNPMNIIITSASLDGSDLQAGDEIAVFDTDGQDGFICVGTATLSGPIQAGTPLTLIASTDDPDTTPKDGFTDNNEILFRVYDQSEDIEYTNVDASFNVSFDTDFSSLGTAIVELNALTSVTQEIDIISGWNIVSFNNAPENMNMLDILQPMIDEGSLIKAINEAGGFIQNIPGIGWMNTIGLMQNTEGYYIKSTSNTILPVEGMPVSLPYDIPLHTGWNIIGFSASSEQNAIDVLQDVIDAGALIKVINEAGGFIQNIPGIGWMNTIGNFVPGEGYYVKVSSNVTLTLQETDQVYKDNTILKNPAIGSKLNPVQNTNPYQPMHLLFDITGLGNMIQTGDEMGVFQNDICIGSSVITATNEPLIIVVASDDPTTSVQDGGIDNIDIQLKHYNSSTNSYNELSTFQSLQFGALETERIDLLTDVDLNNVIYEMVESIFPNPLNGKGTIKLNLNQASNVEISLYNMQGIKEGEIVKTYLNPGSHMIYFSTSDYAQGIYMLQIHAQNKIEYHKVVIN